MKITHIKNSQTPIRDFGPGLGLQILLDKENGSQKLDMGTVNIDPKSETDYHTRTFDEIIVMLEGEGQVITETRIVYNLTQYDCVLIPAGVSHKHRNNSDAPLKQLYIFSPQSNKTMQKKLRNLPIKY